MCHETVIDVNRDDQDDGDSPGVSIPWTFVAILLVSNVSLISFYWYQHK